MLRPSVAKINSSNFISNLNFLKKINGENNFFCPMLKANAYGHGDIELARVLKKADVKHIGLALFEEAVSVRQAGFSTFEILVFHPLVGSEDAEICALHSITPVVSNWRSLEVLAQKSKSKKLQIHLKFNTGMSRLGFELDEAERLADFLTKNFSLELTGICTHLLSGEDYSVGLTENTCPVGGRRSHEQIQKFDSVLKYFKKYNFSVHILNSSALIAKHCYLSAADGSANLKNVALNNLSIGARPGISLFGVKQNLLSPNDLAETAWREIDLKPCMEIESNIVHIQKIKKGETVSYGGTFRADKNSVIGIVPFGYADGYPRRFSNSGKMLCCGHFVPVVGRVCMDFTMVNLSQVQNKSSDLLGEKVTILGQQNKNFISASDLAKTIDTNEYEIFTNISSRVPRKYI